MNKENKNIEMAATSLKNFSINNDWSNAAMTIGKVIVSLYTIKSKKWDVNFNDVFLLDNTNYKNLITVLNYLYKSNQSPCQLLGEEFIQYLIKKYK